MEFQITHHDFFKICHFNVNVWNTFVPYRKKDFSMPHSICLNYAKFYLVADIIEDRPTSFLSRSSANKDQKLMKCAMFYTFVIIHFLIKSMINVKKSFSSDVSRIREMMQALMYCAAFHELNTRVKSQGSAKECFRLIFASFYVRWYELVLFLMPDIHLFGKVIKRTIEKIHLLQFALH